MNTAALAGIFRALAGPLVAALDRVGIDASWLVDPEIAGLIVGLLCAVWSVRAKKAPAAAPAVQSQTPPNDQNP